MKSLITIFLSLFVSAAFALEVGDTAPEFAVKAQDGKTYKLSDFKGRYLVLEWYNKDCPYVRKHYDANNMQGVQQQVTTDKDLKSSWLTVLSSAKGKQGYLDQKQASEQYKKENMKSNALLLDESGKMGKAYGAKTTPHMYVINPEGKVVYMGAIDSISSADSKDIKMAQNYVVEAITELKSAKTITNSSTKPYGCGIKYK